MNDTTIAEPETHPAPVADGFLPAYRFIEFCSVASRVGKSTLADFTTQLLAQFGIPVKHVRIESKAARSRHADVVQIDTENFAAAARLPGAEAAVLRPLFEIIEAAALDEARPVIVLDCGGGISALRAQIYAATSSPRAALIMRPVGILSATARSESNCK